MMKEEKEIPVSDHLLEVRNLQTLFHQEKGILKAVNGISYYVDPGEIIAFVGESGSGKSVSQYSGLRLIQCPPGEIAGGEVLFRGENLLSYADNSEALRNVRGGRIGVIFQEPMTSLNPVMSVGRQLSESIKLHLGLDKQETQERCIELLGLVGIPDALSRLSSYPHQFSGGMRQRIMIAMALSCNPELLIADEATTALDVTTQAQILELMQDIVRKTNTALVIVTHNLSVVAKYADRIYVMYAGDIVESGKTEHLFSNPKHPYTIGLLNAVPSLHDPKDRKLIPIEGFVTDLVNRKDACMFMNRCRYAKDICKTSKAPKLVEVEGEKAHFYACYEHDTGIQSLYSQVCKSERHRITDKCIKGDEEILSVKDLKVYFPVRAGIFGKKIADVKAIDDVNFSIRKGETFGLVGESGCGKSTMAKAVLRLLEPTSGKIYFKGSDITTFNDDKMRELRRNMSMIFQDPYGSLDPRQRAGDIVMEPLRNYKKGMSRKEMDDRVDDLFKLVGLDPEYRERVPHEFSGGQRQRLVIARSLSTNPQFIACDEAISALDVSIQAQIINLLEELQERLGLTYLFIAHDLSVVRHISDRVAVMYLGKIMEIADWKALYDNPLHPYTQALLSAVPLPDPVLEKVRPRQIIHGELPSPMHRPEGCPFSTRCDRVMDICHHSVPELKDAEPGHAVACHLFS